MHSGYILTEYVYETIRQVVVVRDVNTCSGNRVCL